MRPVRPILARLEYNRLLRYLSAPADAYAYAPIKMLQSRILSLRDLSILAPALDSVLLISCPSRLDGCNSQVESLKHALDLAPPIVFHLRYHLKSLRDDHSVGAAIPLR